MSMFKGLVTTILKGVVESLSSANKPTETFGISTSILPAVPAIAELQPAVFEKAHRGGSAVSQKPKRRGKKGVRRCVDGLTRAERREAPKAERAAYNRTSNKALKRLELDLALRGEL